jgi:hypothetical protein
MVATEAEAAEMEVEETGAGTIEAEEIRAAVETKRAMPIMGAAAIRRAARRSRLNAS